MQPTPEEVAETLQGQTRRRMRRQDEERILADWLMNNPSSLALTAKLTAGWENNRVENCLLRLERKGLAAKSWDEDAQAYRWWNTQDATCPPVSRRVLNNQATRAAPTGPKPRSAPQQEKVLTQLRVTPGYRVDELARLLGWEPALVSAHLGTLYERGKITRERVNLTKGRWTYEYYVAPDGTEPPTRTERTKPMARLITDSEFLSAVGSGATLEQVGRKVHRSGSGIAQDLHRLVKEGRLQREWTRTNTWYFTPAGTTPEADGPTTF
jgi:hypothetical protein